MQILSVLKGTLDAPALNYVTSLCICYFVWQRLGGDTCHLPFVVWLFYIHVNLPYIGVARAFVRMIAADASRLLHIQTGSDRVQSGRAGQVVDSCDALYLVCCKLSIHRQQQCKPAVIQP